MENLNAEQIKKALECCYMQELEHNENCPECPYTDSYPNCTEYLGKRALALINSQEQRIGAQDMTISELRQRAEKAEHDADRYAQRIKELTEQAYRLECDLQLNADEKAVAKAIEQTKKATVRKMQERLTKDFDRLHKNNFITPEVRQWIIDQIAKEMLEEGVT